MKLEIPLQLKLSANLIYAGRHWAQRKKDADVYHTMIKEACRKASRINNYPVNIVIWFYFKNRPLDCSNCFYMAKLCEDGLIKAGILKDDSPEYVDCLACVSRVDKQNPRIEISIESV